MCSFRYMETKLRWIFAVFNCCSLIIKSIYTEAFLNIIFLKHLRSSQENVCGKTVGETGGRLGKEGVGRTFFIPSHLQVSKILQK